MPSIKTEGISKGLFYYVKNIFSNKKLSFNTIVRPFTSFLNSLYENLHFKAHLELSQIQKKLSRIMRNHTY